VPRFSHLALGALDLALSDLFHSTCLGCDSLSRAPLCARCHWFPWLPEQAGSPVQAALDFQEPWREVLHRIKFGKHRELLRLFRPVVAAFDFGFVPPEAWVVPVPIHASTLRTRGFNQSETLAHWIAQSEGLRFAPDSLVKRRATEKQSTLNAEKRATNLVGSFEWRDRRPAPAAVMLVDDVYTTGATYQACKEALRRAGMETPVIWTLFRARGQGN